MQKHTSTTPKGKGAKPAPTNRDGSTEPHAVSTEVRARWNKAAFDSLDYEAKQTVLGINGVLALLRETDGDVSVYRDEARMLLGLVMENLDTWREHFGNVINEVQQ